MKRFEAMVVDFVAWMQAFRPKDFVVLKIDVERAEREIIEGLLGNGTMRNVDILMWECHLGPVWCEMAEACAKASGVQAVYREPYDFAPTV